MTNFVIASSLCRRWIMWTFF